MDVAALGTTHKRHAAEALLGRRNGFREGKGTRSTGLPANPFFLKKPTLRGWRSRPAKSGNHCLVPRNEGLKVRKKKERDGHPGVREKHVNVYTAKSLTKKSSHVVQKRRLMGKEGEDDCAKRREDRKVHWICKKRPIPYSS